MSAGETLAKLGISESEFRELLQALDRKPYVWIGGTVRFGHQVKFDRWIEQPAGWGVGLTTVEVNLGSVPRRSGYFTIAGSGLTTGKPVLVQQAAGPYTGKGTREDEAEMDQVLATGKVLSKTSIGVWWHSRSAVRGNFKFQYGVSG